MADEPRRLYKPALLHALKQGYTRHDLLADTLAGLLVGVVALPLSMGLAIASGATAEQGLYAAIVGGFLISLLGGSRVQVGGPAGAFVGICAAAAVNAHVGLFGLSIATFLAGGMILAMGLMRLGKSISLIPIPVVIGFTTGIAVTIASTQLAPLLGIASPSFENVVERVSFIWKSRADIHWQAALMCATTIAIITVLRHWKPMLPGALIAVVVVTVLGIVLGWSSAGGSLITIGSIPSAPPYPHLPGLVEGNGWSFDALWRQAQVLDWEKIGILAATIAVLSSIETLLSAVVADGMSGYRHDSNTELIGLGAANMIVPFFSVLPVTGVIARTSVNIRAGARSPVAGIIHALALLIILVACAPLVAYIPMACLAGVLLVVCWHMAELRHWPYILKAERSDALLLPLATGLTIFMGLTMAVFSGVILAMFFFVRRMVENTQVERYTSNDSSEHALSANLPKGVEVYEVRGPFFFGAATLLRDIDDMFGKQSQVLILRLGNVPFVDATAGLSLKELLLSCQKRGATLVLSDLQARPHADLQRLGLIDLIGEQAVFDTYAAALAAAKRIVAV